MSKCRRRTRADGRATGVARASTVVVLVTLWAVVATAVAAPALAYWTATGSAPGAATTGTLAAPTEVTVPAAADLDVPVSWTPGTGGPTPQGYYVTRNGGTDTAPACGSSVTAPIQDVACTDTAVPTGTYTYLVTAVY